MYSLLGIVATDNISGNYLAAFAIVLHFSHVSSPKWALTVSQDLMLHLQPPELSAFSLKHAPKFIGLIQ